MSQSSSGRKRAPAVALTAVILCAVLGFAIPSAVAAKPGLDPSTLGQRPSGSFLKPDRLARAERELGAEINWYVGMAGRRSPEDMKGSVYGQLRKRDAVLPTVADRMNLVMTVPLAFGKGTAKTEVGRDSIRTRLLETAEGTWDSDYRTVAETLVTGGYPDAVIRLGHEFTGSWYPWSAQGNPDAYIAAYRHVHQVMRSVSPDFRFEWNAARNTFAEYGPPAYPGDAYVDVVGLDVYYEPWKGDKAFTDDYWNRRYLRVLEAHQEFAAEHGKPVSYAEWANGNIDQPEFIEAMYGWFSSLPRSGPGSLLYHSYFNVNNAQHNLDYYPKTKAAYLRLFGGGGPANPDSPADIIDAPPPPLIVEPIPSPDPAGSTPRPPDDPEPGRPVIIIDTPAPVIDVPAQLKAVRGQWMQVEAQTDAPRIVWWKHRGPGPMSWDDKRILDPTIRFHASGTYVLTANARDGDRVTRAYLTVEVAEPTAGQRSAPVEGETPPRSIVEPEPDPPVEIAPPPELAERAPVEPAPVAPAPAPVEPAPVAPAPAPVEPAPAPPPPDHDHDHKKGSWVKVGDEKATYRDSTVGVTHHIFDFRKSKNPPDDWGASRIGFLVRCEAVKFDQIDPIVDPGKAKSGHLHEFFGNPNVTPHSTTQSLADTPRSRIDCSDTNDKSAYWTPAVYQDGTRVGAHQFKAYYKGQTPDAVPMPFGLRMIAGDATATRNQPSQVGWWQSGSGTTRNSASMVSLAGGNGQITLRVNFPDCWDGKHLDSPDHQSHVAYSKGQRCPASHPVKIPQLTTFTDYRTKGGEGLTLSSGSWRTFHQDFWNVWSPDQMEALTERCIQAEVNCRARRSPDLVPRGQYPAVIKG